jgi:hypothetical protein
MNDYYLWNALGNPLETTMTAAHMIMAGVMEAHPNLKVMLSHGGGAILSLRGRLRHAHSFQPMAKARLQQSPEDSLKKFYFDTTVVERINTYFHTEQFANERKREAEAVPDAVEPVVLDCRLAVWCTRSDEEAKGCQKQDIAQ